MTDAWGVDVLTVLASWWLLAAGDECTGGPLPRTDLGIANAPGHCLMSGPYECSEGFLGTEVP